MISEEKMNQIQPRINNIDKDSKNIASCELSKFVEEELSMNNLPNYKNCGIDPCRRQNKHIDSKFLTARNHFTSRYFSNPKLHRTYWSR